MVNISVFSLIIQSYKINRYNGAIYHFFYFYFRVLEQTRPNDLRIACDGSSVVLTQAIFLMDMQNIGKPEVNKHEKGKLYIAADMSKAIVFTSFTIYTYAKSIFAFAYIQ